MSEIDLDDLLRWIGREQTVSDTIEPRLVASFNATFDVDSDLAPGAEAPVGIHWCLAPDIAPMHALGPDGHPARGGFLPPVPLPRRMWAGGRLAFKDSLRIGDVVSKRSIIDDVTLKTGRSGELIFVTVRHLYATARGPALEERQDIVYRAQEAASPKADAPVIPHPAPSKRHATITPSPTLLFRYSAVTFNGHRIHYDLAYARAEEGYPGLVVHGPLQATYLLRLAVALQSGALPRGFDFRAVRPLFAGAEMTINSAPVGTGTELWVADETGRKTMSATITG